MLSSKIITVKSRSQISGNVILISDEVFLLDEGQIDSLKVGCKLNEEIGSPSLFVSQSFSCGLNGGSYGGRGGVGINEASVGQGNSSHNAECIKHSYTRMESYGDPLVPLHSGSTGSAFSRSFRSFDIVAPGVIFILCKKLEVIRSSFIRSGYPMTDQLTGVPSNSGGSIYLIYKDILISQDSEISANGQTSDDYRSGAGSGGRIFLHNYCWAEEEEELSPNYNFQVGRVMASAGFRSGLNNLNLEREMLERIKAEEGSKEYYYNP